MERKTGKRGTAEEVEAEEEAEEEKLTWMHNGELAKRLQSASKRNESSQVLTKLYERGRDRETHCFSSAPIGVALTNSFTRKQQIEGALEN